MPTETRAEPVTADLSRRDLLRCAAVCGVGLPVLAACGSSSKPKGSGAIAAVADVPVGGGVVNADQSVVVTQPTKGVFHGFSSRCTHQGFTLGAVTNGVIVCPNHGSQFAITDGHNVMGPNGEAAGSVPDLPKIPVKVVKGNVVRA